MTLAYVALLRAVNVGGTGRLPMADLVRMCADAGFSEVQTYLASGNVVFECAASEPEVKAALETRLQVYAGKRVGVVIRNAAEMAGVAADNPFPQASPSRSVAIFLDAPPPPDALAQVRGQSDEEMALGRREIYVHYGADMGQSKLRIPAAAYGTARNMATVAKLAALAGEF